MASERQQMARNNEADAMRNANPEQHQAQNQQANLINKMMVVQDPNSLQQSQDPAHQMAEQAAYDQNRALVQQITQQNHAMAQQMSEMNAQMQQLQQQVETDRMEKRSLERRIVELQQHSIASTAPSQDPEQNRVRTLTEPNLLLNPPNLTWNAGAPWNGSVAPPSGSIVSSTLTHKPFELPEFNGLPEQWPVFIAAFNQSTEAFGYSALQNTFRLQKCLKGEAREAVEFLLINPDNVNELIQTLEFRFGRPEILAQSQMSRIRDIPEINERRIDQLIQFSTRISNMVAFLNTDASRHILSETTLLSELVLKLPQSKQLEWTQHAMSIKPRPTVVDFSTWLKKIAECISILVSSSHTRPTSSSTFVRNPPSHSQPNHRPGKHVLVNVPLPTSSQSCEVCYGPHIVTECPRFWYMKPIDRWSEARRLQLCFQCLQSGHRIGDCSANIPNEGDAEYHELLHNPNPAGRRRRNLPQGSNRNLQAPAVSSEEPVPETATASSGQQLRPNPFRGPPPSDPSVLSTVPGNNLPSAPPLFRILPVTLYGPHRQADTYALLDEGSALTLIDEDLSQHLQLVGNKSILGIRWIGQHTTSEPSRTVELTISGASQRKFNLTGVRTIPKLNLPTQSLRTSQLGTRMRSLPLADYEHVTPKILIGLDHCRLGMARKTVTNLEGGPIATQTSLGWVIYGPQYSSPAHVLHLVEADRWDYLDNIIREHLTTENFGVKKPEQVMESDGDVRAREIMRSTTSRVGGRFQTGLLWKDDNITLPDSYQMARQRLNTIERKMRRDPDYKRLYTLQIDTYLKKGYARRLSPEEARVTGNRNWYLPHFSVQHVSKPGKLRLVFDAAASVNGVSLNTSLLKGPDLNQPLVKILFGFRMRRIGICADIEEMFSQVQIQPSDRCSQRFLWRTNGAEEPDVYEMQVMTFGATCSPTSAQFVKNLNAAPYEENYPAAVKAIYELHYVDDYVASFATEEDALQVTSDVVRIHKGGGFNLRGFVSNSKKVLDGLGASSSNESGVNLELDSAATEKILGLRWCTGTDTFVFGMRFDGVDSDIISGLRRPTKRELLSAAMSVFDPFGFIANYMMHTKIMVQALWRLGVAWDEAIPEKLYQRWKVWCSEISNLKRFSIPRCYSHKLLISDEVQLHIFADASEEAFAAVAYWRIVHEGGCDVAFIVGKVKCAPLKILSVPRLELQAAVLASRLCSTIKECHADIRVSQTFLWTDSRTVQQWIQSTERRFRPFVAYRVGEILDITRVAWWRWLPTNANVADDATRSCERPRFDPNSRWLRGPGFLYEDECRWPSTTTTEVEPVKLVDLEEINPHLLGIVNEVPNLINFNRFSDFLRACRSCAWALRFINNLNARRRDLPRKRGELSIEEIQDATDLLCQQAQRNGYPAEYAALSAGRKIDRTSTLITMMPYMDDRKLIRLYGRTDSADVQFLPADAQRPILLPRNHRFTELLIHHHHKLMGHQFEDGTICSIRSRYWVPKLRPLVRNAKKICPVCKIRTAKPCPEIAGQLPADRLTPHVPAFNFTGLDYFGPVNVTVGRRHEKRWIALFTCLTTRAVHMEVAQDLSTDACLLCIKNFCNLRGVPARIRSDCGTNFVGADREIRRTDDFIDQTEVQRQLSTRGIEWRMNCPGNPEAGGAWERLVQSTKRILAVTLKEVAPRVETLRSLVIEAANILNSRPLTNVPVNPNDLEPLTPNHFLLGRVNSTTTTGEIDIAQLCSRKQWRIQQQLIRQFWRRWVQYYLPELTRRTKFYKEVAPVKEGTLVLICDANQPRGQWARGRVERVFAGTDGRVRSAEVRTKSGLVRRPVSKLAVLDVVESSSQ